MRFHEFSWKISNFQSWFFSKFRCEIQVLFMRFHKFSWKISNFQSSPFYKFRCEIQVFVMRFHEFSWKNIKLSKFTLFPVQICDSSIIHALSWIFMKKYQNFKFHPFPGSNVRLKYYSCAFMNFHEKKTFKVHFFPVQMWDSSITSSISCAFMNFHEKIPNFRSSLFSKWDSSICHALSWIFM